MIVRHSSSFFDENRLKIALKIIKKIKVFYFHIVLKKQILQKSFIFLTMLHKKLFFSTF